MAVRAQPATLRGRERLARPRALGQLDGQRLGQVGLHQARVLVDDCQGRELGRPQVVDSETADQVLEQ